MKNSINFTTRALTRGVYYRCLQDRALKFARQYPGEKCIKKTHVSQCSERHLLRGETLPGLARVRVHDDLLLLHRRARVHVTRLGEREKSAVGAFLEQKLLPALSVPVFAIIYRSLLHRQRQHLDDEIGLGLVHPGEVQLDVLADVLVLARYVVAVRARRCHSLDTVTALVRVHGVLVGGGERAALTTDQVGVGLTRRRDDAFPLHEQQALLVLIGGLYRGIVRAIVASRRGAIGVIVRPQGFPRADGNRDRGRIHAVTVHGNSVILVLPAQCLRLRVRLVFPQVLHVIRVVLDRVVAYVAAITLLRAVQRQVDPVLFALLEGRRAFMALVSLLLQATITQITRINKVWVPTHEDIRIRVL